MNAKLYGITIGLVVILFCSAGFFFWMTAIQKPAQTVVDMRGQLPIADSASRLNEASGSSTMAVLDSSGNGVLVLNFLKASTTIEDAFNSGLYHIGLSAVASATPPYEITYEKATQYFNISLTSEPIGQSRTMMEQSLEGSLGLTQEAMCQLNYMISVPYQVNQFYAGKNLGFSFCPGATQLP